MPGTIGQLNLLDRAKLPRRYSRLSFQQLQADRPDHRQIALQFAMKFTHEFPAVDRGMLFTGPVGVGKTHLAVSILMGLSERGFDCLFYEFGSLLKEIQDSYNPNTQTSELGVLAPVLNAEVLVLDELGASKPTDWVRDTMAHVINTRYNDKRPRSLRRTIPTTGQNEREETLEDRIGVRLRSRLFEMCKAVEMKGTDYRTEK